MEELELYLIEQVVLSEFLARDVDFRPNTLLITRLSDRGEDRLEPSSIVKAWKFDGTSLLPIEKQEVSPTRNGDHSPTKDPMGIPLFEEGIVDFYLENNRFWVDHHYGPKQGHGAAYRLRETDGHPHVLFESVRWVDQG